MGGIKKPNKHGCNNPAWKGGIQKTSRGYVNIIVSYKHPRKSKKNLVKEHVLVMERRLGRLLNSQEVIHHINGKPDDNRIENLMLCKDAFEHRRIHNGWFLENDKWFKICKKCNRKLEVNTENFAKKYLNKNKFSSYCKQCVRLISKKYYNDKYRNIKNHKINQLS